MIPDEVKQAEREQKLALLADAQAEATHVLEQRRASFRIFLEPEWGEECLRHIEHLGFVHRSAIKLDGQGRVDPYILATREGRRELALEIRDYVTRLKQSTQERAIQGLVRRA